MATINRDAQDRETHDIGEAVTITNYTADVTYSTEQVPTRASAEVNTVAKIKIPSKKDIDITQGRITLNDKKFILLRNITINNGDHIVIDSDPDVSYVVKEIGTMPINGNEIKKMVFASKVE